jgi:hypothetical protein
MIALPCLDESLVCKLLEAHPQISLVVVLADLSDERSDKTLNDIKSGEPWERVVNCW